MVAVLARPPDGLTVACAVRELELRLALAGTPRGCVTGNLQLCSPARSCSASHIPGEALERIFKSTLELLVAYKDQVAESKRQNAAAADDLDGFDADEEDEEVESDKEMGLDDEDGDGVNNFDPQSFAEVRAMILTYHLHFNSEDDSDDEYSDDEELQTPIDEVDPFIFFVETIQALQASDPGRFQNLMQTMDFHYQALASGVAQHAEERKTEIAKEKLEKANTQ
nr:unnamed protein product [Digitaria exilis]